MSALCGAAVLGLYLLGGAASGAGDVKVTSGPVAGVEDPGGDADGVVHLKDGTQCTLGREDPRFATWLRLLKSARASGLPVYLECAGGAARTLLPFAARRIEKVDAAAGDQATVTIFMSPSLHHLRTGRGDYAALRALLEEAVKSGQPLLLAVDPRTLEILAARKPEPGARATPIL